jgi:hypothetical protein
MKGGRQREGEGYAVWNERRKIEERRGRRRNQG